MIYAHWKCSSVVTCGQRGQSRILERAVAGGGQNVNMILFFSHFCSCYFISRLLARTCAVARAAACIYLGCGRKFVIHNANKSHVLLLYCDKVNSNHARDRYQCTALPCGKKENPTLSGPPTHPLFSKHATHFHRPASIPNFIVRTLNTGHAHHLSPAVQLRGPSPS